ncbi:MAG: ATP-binding protein [Deltaproteobacteria bacterium]|jgi:hypothetical protein|nr:ATP-binding protein [Deltaproteobacteria bacterium]
MPVTRIVIAYVKLISLKLQIQGGRIMETKNLFQADLTFKQIRQGNHIYADKTEYIYNILNGKPTLNCCFLSRPRRFGKTLLLDTIGELFQGDRELFKGLWIDKSDYKFESHPVQKFNMATYANLNQKGNLTGMIKADLKMFAKQHKIKFSSNYYSKMLEELLKDLSNKYGAGVVLLVDEYDAPVTRYILNQDIARNNRDDLHDFYSVVKASIQYVRLAFVTGITRFAMTSLDSGPNNFTDISLQPKFGGICGFTEDEMDTVFGDRYEDTLKGLKANKEIAWNAKRQGLKNKILNYYDGYNWLGPDNVLNPYSLLRFFSSHIFEPHWPLSGQPSHLSALVRKDPLAFILPKLESYPAVEARKAELSTLKPVPVLFHSGYLTIDQPVTITEKKNKKIIKKKGYSFKIPNTEVREDFEFNLFLYAFDPLDHFFGTFATELPVALMKNDSRKTALHLHNLLSAIASEQHEPSEKHYHAIVQAAFIASGLEVLSQTSSSYGKSDIAVFHKNVRFVMEVKYCKADNKAKSEKDLDAALDKAVKQIRMKDYGAPFRPAGKKIIGVAIAVRGRDEVAVRFIEL